MPGKTFNDINEVRKFVANLPGGLTDDSFKVTAGLSVCTINEMGLLNNPNTSEETKKCIRDKMAAQIGFECKKKDGEPFNIVISLDEKGKVVECWFVYDQGPKILL